MFNLATEETRFQRKKWNLETGTYRITTENVKQRGGSGQRFYLFTRLNTRVSSWGMENYLGLKGMRREGKKTRAWTFVKLRKYPLTGWHRTFSKYLRRDEKKIRWLGLLKYYYKSKIYYDHYLLKGMLVKDILFCYC